MSFRNISPHDLLSSTNSLRNIHDGDDDDIEIVQYKVIVLGDGAVGKTSICIRFAEDKFSQVYKQTVGCDFFVGKLELTRNVDVC